MVQIGNFNPDEHEKPQSPDPLPNSWYGMVISNTDVINTKGGAGAYLSIEHTVLESMHPEHKGRKVWNNLNLWHNNPQVVAIAQSQLKSIADAVGVGEFNETSVLHDKPIAVKVIKVPPRDNYDEKNEVKGYDAIQRVSQGGPVSTAPALPTAAQAHAAPAPQAAPAPAPQAAPPQAAPPAQGQPPQGDKPAWQQ